MTAGPAGEGTTSGGPPHVLVLGSGYSAIGACRAMRPAIRAGRVRATVVGRENHHFFHGYVAEMLTGRIAPGSVLSPSRRVFAPARVHQAEIDGIDLAERTVTTRRHLDGLPQEIAYDHLVLALGSVDNLAAYPGLAEHAFRLKTYEDCFRLRNHILSMLELADFETDPEERRRLLTFFIAGGGYAGTEVAGELATYLGILMADEYQGLSPAESRVILVHPGDHILPELYGDEGRAGHPRLVDYAARRIAEVGVEIRTNTRVLAVSPNEVTLSTGERVPTRTIVSAVGTRPPPILDALDLPRSDRGRVVTDEFLRVRGFDAVWATGDCAEVPHHRGGTCPPVATFAMKEGSRAARNILAVLDGRPPARFRHTLLGQGVCLGRHRATGELRGHELSGVLPWVLFKAILLYYVPTWDRRMRIMSDWVASATVGRDIVNMRIGDSDDFEISNEVYQPGEDLAAEDRPGRYIRVIVEGTVDLLRRTGDGEELIRALGPGDNLGREWLDLAAVEVARARTEVRTVALRTDQIGRLRRVMAGLERATAGLSP